MLDYSIVIPVYNRDDLTKQCLQTLPPTLEGAGSGEVIVVDNGSEAATATMLAAFPWVRVIRNERNLGFAAACNQGARAAHGRLVCHLNNDIVARPGWLARLVERMEDGVGIAGARLVYPNGTLQHAGVAIRSTRFGPEGIGPFHVYAGDRGDLPAAAHCADMQVVTGACLLTPRELFIALGGFDELYWNGYEDVDYCFRVRARGLRVVYEPAATLVHFESQSGIQRKRRLAHNLQALGRRWGSRIEPDHNEFWVRSGFIRREHVGSAGRRIVQAAIPPAVVVVHGERAADVRALHAALDAAAIPPSGIVWLATDEPPAGAVRAPLDPLAAVRAVLRERHDRYVVFVDAATQLTDRWFARLRDAVEYGTDVCAATVIPPGESVEACEPAACDARCSIVNLRAVPADIDFRYATTVDGALVEFTRAAVAAGLAVRAARGTGVHVGPSVSDPGFLARFGREHDVVRRPDLTELETLDAASADEPFASIVMLSWNAPEYTKLAVESVRRHTTGRYEIIIVDNGSDAPTRAMLAELHDVRVHYNAANTGFANGCNRGIAMARGTHVVLLNNDVVVTDGWLDALLAAQRRHPRIAVTAPRSNAVAGHQCLSTSYGDLDAMHAFARARRERHAGTFYQTDRAIGFCLCIARRVIETVGGIDPRYGAGNFEDDDFCVRVRAAGYLIAVCEDAFIHHFGSVTFKTNGVDYSALMARNWSIFAARWNLPAQYPQNGYDIGRAIANGFVPERDYVALPEHTADATHPAAPVIEGSPAPAGPVAARTYRTAFAALVASDDDWSRVGPLIANYLKALRSSDDSVLLVAVADGLNAATVGARVERTMAKLGRSNDEIADIVVEDVASVEGWLASIPAPAVWRLHDDRRLATLPLAPDRSPSGLVRTVRAVPA